MLTEPVVGVVDHPHIKHSWGSTTAIYCSVSDDYKNRIMAKAVAGMFRRPEEGDTP